MPVIFNEPLSFLQRVAEYMEYAKLLKLAAQEETPIRRLQVSQGSRRPFVSTGSEEKGSIHISDTLQYVAAFAVSALASNWERLGKPFNPILGETYELEREDFR